MRYEVRNQLKGIVSIWLTNGQRPVDGGNDTRYEFFTGSWMDAANATTQLIDLSLVEAPKVTEYEYDIGRVVPTAKGIFEAIT